MIKQAPSLGRILAMVVFALSCFGILVFLWLAFGGPLPLQPEGYRVRVQFDDAAQLAQEAEVRISGVPVGRVKKEDLDESTGLTEAVIEIESRYAPLPRDTRAILRQKSLLGETYVELTPGGAAGPRLPDGARLPRGQVSPTVELDEIFRAFDPETRALFSTWLDQQGIAVSRQGQELNDALASLEPFADDVEEVLEVLDEQSGATRGLVRDTGEVFAALTERQGQLRQLISSSNRVFSTTAQRNRELASAFVVLPTFLDETRATTRRVTRFARVANPLITQLRPAARALSPTLRDLNALAPDLRAFNRALGPLNRVARRGLPATERFIDELEPLLERLDPYLADLNPILQYLGLYRREIAAFFANDTAATQAGSPGPGGLLHYLRVSNPLNPEILAPYPHRLATNRSNPYTEPGGYSKLPTNLEVFGSYLCTDNPLPTLSPDIPENLRNLVQQFVFTDDPGGPACKEQQPLGRFVGQPGRYPQLQRSP
ncbi:MAG TPA: MlaD family protein [Thermoleophilaceae bacterium]|nr:MlaD family protein [Thermoleophilaceae bacterium]